MDTIKELQIELDELKDELLALVNHKHDIESQEESQDYDELLDEGGEVNVGGITFMPSRILKEMDPTAYKCGLNDYNDGHLSELEDEIEEKKQEIKEKEEEIAAAEQE